MGIDLDFVIRMENPRASHRFSRYWFGHRGQARTWIWNGAWAERLSAKACAYAECSYSRGLEQRASRIGTTAFLHPYNKKTKYGITSAEDSLYDAH